MDWYQEQHWYFYIIHIWISTVTTTEFCQSSHSTKQNNLFTVNANLLTVKPRT